MRYSERREGRRERRTATDNSRNSSLRFVLTLLLLLLLGDRFEFHDFFHLITTEFSSSSLILFLLPLASFFILFSYSSSSLPFFSLSLSLPSYPWFIWIMSHSKERERARTFWQLSYQTQSFTWHHSPSYCYILCSLLTSFSSIRFFLSWNRQNRIRLRFFFFRYTFSHLSWSSLQKNVSLFLLSNSFFHLNHTHTQVHFLLPREVSGWKEDFGKSME